MKILCSAKFTIYSNISQTLHNIYTDFSLVFPCDIYLLAKSAADIATLINKNIKPKFIYAELIGITPNPNNGTRGSLHHILKKPKTLPQQIEPDPPATGSVPSDELEYNYRVYAANCSCSQVGLNNFFYLNVEIFEYWLFIVVFSVFC